MSSLVCGLDVHKDSVYATVMNYGGEIVDKRKLTNDKVVSYLGRYPIDKVVMESSASIVPVYRALRGKEYEILVSHPKKTRLIAESRIKTDRVDSWALTELDRLDALPLSYVPPDDIAALREKVRRRAFLVRMRSKLKVKIKAQPIVNGFTPPPSMLVRIEGAGVATLATTRRGRFLPASRPDAYHSGGEAFRRTTRIGFRR